MISNINNNKINSQPGSGLKKPEAKKDPVLQAKQAQGPVVSKGESGFFNAQTIPLALESLDLLYDNYYRLLTSFEPTRQRIADSFDVPEETEELDKKEMKEKVEEARDLYKKAMLMAETAQTPEQARKAINAAITSITALPQGALTNAESKITQLTFALRDIEQT